MAYYSVYSPKYVAIFDDWNKASPYTNKRSNVLHKKFNTYEDAHEFLAENMSIEEFDVYRPDIRRYRINFVQFINMDELSEEYQAIIHSQEKSKVTKKTDSGPIKIRRIK